jgi:predicted kinase
MAFAQRSPVVLLITGPPASGKSTIGRQLASELRLPFLSKDLFKESLFDTLGWTDRAWSQRLGYASTKLLFTCAAALLAAGGSVVLESNFYAEFDTPDLVALRDKYGCHFVQVVCSADPATLADRFERRALSTARHPGHRDGEHVAEWRERLLTQRWEALPLDGPVLTVDTNGADPGQYRELVRRVATLLDQTG